MVSITDLVRSEKENKEYLIFDKAQYICRSLGKKDFDNYKFNLGEDFRMCLFYGHLENNFDFNHLFVKDIDNNTCFDYFHVFHSDLKSNDTGIVNIYAPGFWEGLIENYYELVFS